LILLDCQLQTAELTWNTNGKNITLEPPFRFIDSTDAEKTFVNELAPINNVNLANILSENTGCRYVIVYEFNEEILAFVVSPPYPSLILVS
jgi:hypothetical protein